MKTQNSTTNQNKKQKSETKNCEVSVEHRGVRVCGLLGCDQYMKTENSTTNLPGLSLVFYSLMREVNVKHRFVFVVESIDKNKKVGKIF